MYLWRDFHTGSFLNIQSESIKFKLSTFQNFYSLNCYKQLNIIFSDGQKLAAKAALIGTSWWEVWEIWLKKEVSYKSLIL